MNIRLFIVIACLSVAGCSSDRSKPAATEAPKVSQPVEIQTYRLKGVVREVDPKSGVVTIAHEDMPGLMKAMTMDFTPKDRSNLDELGVGDEVEGPLDVTRSGGSVKDYNLRSLEVTMPAPRTLKLDLGTGTATLAAKVPVLRPGEVVPDFT
jgi:Cu/Ag efflux protein CusF